MMYGTIRRAGRRAEDEDTRARGGCAMLQRSSTELKVKGQPASQPASQPARQAAARKTGLLPSSPPVPAHHARLWRGGGARTEQLGRGRARWGRAAPPRPRSLMPGRPPLRPSTTARPPPSLYDCILACGQRHGEACTATDSTPTAHHAAGCGGAVVATTCRPGTTHCCPACRHAPLYAPVMRTRWAARAPVLAVQARCLRVGG